MGNDIFHSKENASFTFYLDTKCFAVISFPIHNTIVSLLIYYLYDFKTGYNVPGIPPGAILGETSPTK